MSIMSGNDMPFAKAILHQDLRDYEEILGEKNTGFKSLKPFHTHYHFF